MLVLTRKVNEVIRIGGNIRLTVLRVDGNRVRLGIEAPGHVSILRSELGTEDNVVLGELPPGEVPTELDLSR